MDDAQSAKTAKIKLREIKALYGSMNTSYCYNYAIVMCKSSDPEVGPSILLQVVR